MIAFTTQKKLIDQHSHILENHHNLRDERFISFTQKISKSSALHLAWHRWPFLGSTVASSASITRTTQRLTLTVHALFGKREPQRRNCFCHSTLWGPPRVLERTLPWGNHKIRNCLQRATCSMSSATIGMLKTNCCAKWVGVPFTCTHMNSHRRTAS